MGHERLGVLPKTTPWSNIIDQMETLYESGDCSVADIAQEVLKNVRNRYEKLGEDVAIRTVLSALIKLSHAYSHEHPSDRFGELTLDNSISPTVSSVIQAIREKIPEGEINSEYTQLALRATSDALIEWQKEHASTQTNLFEPADESIQPWKELGTGAGFCELSKSFFGNLTERYLNYFLDRAASTHLTLSEKDRFDSELKEYVGEVSKHAFETAKITQSFSAGWFNKYVRDSLPDEKTKRRFINKTFKKLQEEILREETK